MKKWKFVAVVLVVLLVFIFFLRCIQSDMNNVSMNVHVGPPQIYFDHYLGLKSFVLTFADAGAGEDYHCNDCLTEKERQDAVASVTSTLVPHYNGDEYGQMRGQYFLEDYRKQLDLIFNVGGIRYRFNYIFYEVQPRKLEGKPVAKNVSIGAYKVDLYKIDGGLFGRFKIGDILVTVFVGTYNVKELKLEYFEFVSLVE